MNGRSRLITKITQGGRVSKLNVTYVPANKRASRIAYSLNVTRTLALGNRLFAATADESAATAAAAAAADVADAEKASL